MLNGKICPVFVVAIVAAGIMLIWGSRNLRYAGIGVAAAAFIALGLAQQPTCTSVDSTITYDLP